MNMPDMNDIKKTVKDVGSMQVCGSMDLGMKLRRKDDPCHPVKSSELHVGYHVPLVKLALALLISAVALCTVCAVKHHCRRCCDCEDK